MTTTDTGATPQAAPVKKHPVRGAIWGIITGIGLAGLLFVFSVTPYSLTSLLIVSLVMGVLGVVWGLFAPAKKPKGPEVTGGAPPVTSGRPPTAPPPTASRPTAPPPTAPPPDSTGASDDPGPVA